MAQPTLRVSPIPVSLLYPACDVLSCRVLTLTGEDVFSKACALAALHVFFF